MTNHLKQHHPLKELWEIGKKTFKGSEPVCHPIKHFSPFNHFSKTLSRLKPVDQALCVVKSVNSKNHLGIVSSDLTFGVHCPCSLTSWFDSIDTISVIEAWSHIMATTLLTTKVPTIMIPKVMSTTFNPLTQPNTTAPSIQSSWSLLLATPSDGISQRECWLAADGSWSRSWIMVVHNVLLSHLFQSHRT